MDTVKNTNFRDKGVRNRITLPKLRMSMQIRTGKNQEIPKRPVMTYKEGAELQRRMQKLNRRESLRELDPENNQFQYPDFGFEDELNTKNLTIWSLISDHISILPKYERLNKFIRQRNKEKMI